MMVVMKAAPVCRSLVKRNYDTIHGGFRHRWQAAKAPAGRPSAELAPWINRRGSTAVDQPPSINRG
jgi:hypothetical protein